MTFDINDRVIIKPDGRFRNGMFRENPYGISGTIYTITYNDFEFFIYVRWDNGEYNSYHELDLELEQKYLQQQEAKKLLGLK